MKEQKFIKTEKQTDRKTDRQTQRGLERHATNTDDNLSSPLIVSSLTLSDYFLSFPQFLSEEIFSAKKHFCLALILSN